MVMNLLPKTINLMLYLKIYRKEKRKDFKLPRKKLTGLLNSLPKLILLTHFTKNYPWRMRSSRTEITKFKQINMHFRDFLRIL